MINNEFMEWLKSERLWRKKIFANLYNKHDFKFSKKLKSLIGNKVTYQNFIKNHNKVSNVD